MEVGFTDGTGHALNAFNTSDLGLVYVDVTEGDSIAYVEVGKTYGRIALDAVKWKYVDCSGMKPDEFWGTLTYTVHPEDSSYPLTYDYYLDYCSRLEFYWESVEAYNEAVEEYNRGDSSYTYSQLESWYENLKTLEQDLGSTFWEPGGIVETVEIYWN